MLSQPERGQLREIEHWLEESDPELTRTLREGLRSRRPLNRGLLRFALGIIAGLLIVLGLASINVALIVLGSMALGLGSVIHGSGRHRAPEG
ncbi:MAG: DUF3040 domain-containing protein [Haloechinothrix sp.]